MKKIFYIMLFVLMPTLSVAKIYSTDIKLTNQISTQGKILDVNFGKTYYHDNHYSPGVVRLYTIIYKKKTYSCFVKTRHEVKDFDYSTGAFFCKYSE